MGVAVGDVFDMLQVYMGSLYVNNFNQFGRSWQVNVQADPQFRHSLDDVMQMKVRNAAGQMVPLATLATARNISGPVLVMRYNMYPAAAINGNVAPGTSSGEAIHLMQGLAHDVLPPAMGYEWTELTYMQILAGSTAMAVFVLAVVLVFLVLAAQYESWSLPLAVILVVPMCLLCSIAGVALAHMDVNIFTQIGFVVLVGLASKNAILIVEFARQQRDLGRGSKGRHDRGLPAAAAADHDDLAGVHPGRGAAGDRGRGRGGNAPHARHGRLQRHVGRHAVRHLPHPGVLLRHPGRDRLAATAEDECSRKMSSQTPCADSRNVVRTLRVRTRAFWVYVVLPPCPHTECADYVASSAAAYSLRRQSTSSKIAATCSSPTFSSMLMQQTPVSQGLSDCSTSVRIVWRISSGVCLTISTGLRRRLRNVRGRCCRSKRPRRRPNPRPENPGSAPWRKIGQNDADRRRSDESRRAAAAGSTPHRRAGKTARKVFVEIITFEHSLCK